MNTTMLSFIPATALHLALELVLLLFCLSALTRLTAATGSQRRSAAEAAASRAQLSAATSEGARLRGEVRRLEAEISRTNARSFQALVADMEDRGSRARRELAGELAATRRRSHALEMRNHALERRLWAGGEAAANKTNWLLRWRNQTLERKVERLRALLWGGRRMFKDLEKERARLEAVLWCEGDTIRKLRATVHFLRFENPDDAPTDDEKFHEGSDSDGGNRPPWSPSPGEDDGGDGGFAGEDGDEPGEDAADGDGGDGEAGESGGDDDGDDGQDGAAPKVMAT